MKKTRGLLFFGIFAIATGIGFLSASFNDKNVVKAEAKDNYLTFKDGVATLGTYPQTISYIDVETLKASGPTDSLGRYTYQNKQYVTAVVASDYEYTSNQKFNDGSSVVPLNGLEKAFLVEDLKWEVLSIGDGYADLITTRIIDRQVFGTSTNYFESDIYTFNNVVFNSLAFSETDKGYLQSYDKKNPYYINLPDESDLKDFEDEYLLYPSDYAIASYLSANHLSNGQTFVNAPFWTKTIYGDRVKAFWSKQSTTNCLVSDPKIGIRPVIRVAYKSSGGGGSKTPSKSSTTNSGNVTLGLGISFTVIGAGGLVAFFIFWAKKHPSGKPPIWIIASLAGCLVVSVVGLGCLAGGMTGGGGAGCFKTGYYVQVGQYSGNGIQQVGYTAWLLKSDGTASYCSHLSDNTSASDFAPDNYMTGTYKISGSKLTIDIPKHEIKNFGTVGGITIYTIKGCGEFRNSVDTYHWVRGE